MFWETLWPLVFGFSLSGAVQAFVSHQAMQRRLGDHRPTTVARATGYGMISSSCSYAAAATARSLVSKGADFVTANIYMFAATNLLIELVIVLAVLLFIGSGLVFGGLTPVVPGQARVVQLFGRYRGTIRDSGLQWVNPFTRRITISTRIRNQESAQAKVNDADR